MTERTRDWDEATGCDGKVRHGTRGDAMKSISRRQSIHGTQMKIHAYLCDLCHHWHVGKSRYTRNSIKRSYNRRRKHKGK